MCSNGHGVHPAETVFQGDANIDREAWKELKMSSVGNGGILASLWLLPPRTAIIKYP